MTDHGDDAAEAADESEPATAPPTWRRLLIGVATVLVVLTGAGFWVSQSAEATDPLSEDAPGLGELTFRVTSCEYEPDRGGMVVHFVVQSADTGRFTVDVAAVTPEALDNADIPTTHVARYSVAFDGDPTRQEFDVVVPLTEAEHDAGFRTCRYTVNPTED